MKQVEYRVWYLATARQGWKFIEIKLIVEDNFGNILVVQEEGIFDSIGDSKPMLDYLRSIGEIGRAHV